MRFNNFIFSPRFHYRRHIMFWSAYFIYSLITYSHPGLDTLGFWKWILLETIEVLMNMLLQIPFCCIIIYFLLPKYLMRKRYFVFTTMLLLLFIAAYLIYVFNDYVFVRRIHYLVGMDYPNTRLFAISLMNMMVTFPIPAGITLVIKLLKNWYLKVIENEKLISENITAELQLLKAQLHPHFLFNTLNNIYFFILTDVVKAKILVQKLKKLLHYMIDECSAPMVYLNKELELIDNYLELEKIRYNALSIDIKINGDYTNKMITPLLMIPFIENSFKHGASKMINDPWIKLFIEVKDSTLYFSLANSRPVANKDNDEKKARFTNGQGIGLTNVKKRLQLLYPEAHVLQIESTENIFIIEMHVPLQNSISNESKIVTKELISVPA